MRNRHTDDYLSPPQAMDGGGRGRGRHGRHGGRPFDNGDLRLVILRMVADAPRHGYELIKAIEDQVGGAYSPSPGVIYPTLSLLEELGLATVDASQGGRKLYTVTPEGLAHLEANQAAVAAVFARLGARGEVRGSMPPDQIVRAMENLKLALRLKLYSGALHPSQIDSIAAALDQAAVAIDKALPTAVPSNQEYPQ